MKNRIRIQSVLSAWCMIGCLILTSCDDWTETESLPVDNPNIEEQNPELYARYLDNLKAYKNTRHKVVYAWFDNQEETPFNRAQHIDNLPDSVDYIVLMHPDQLVERERQEMKNIRTRKGTKVLFSIGYDELKQAYDEMVKAHQEGEEKETEPESFLSYLTKALQKNLQLGDTYGYDGIVMSFDGKSMLHMSATEKKQYQVDCRVFTEVMNAWVERQTDKWFVFEGKPQNLPDKAILKACRHIILSGTANATNSGKLTYEVLSAVAEEVPTDRFVVMAQTVSLDQADVKTGYWADDSRAIVSTAQWVAAMYADFTAAGLGVYNISNDYYNTKRVYQYTREAIHIMNPSLK